MIENPSPPEFDPRKRHETRGPTPESSVFHFKMTRNDLTGTKVLLVRKIKLIMAHR